MDHPVHSLCARQTASKLPLTTVSWFTEWRMNKVKHRIFHWGTKTVGSKAESGSKVVRRGHQPPPHQLQGLGERCELLSGVRGWAPTTRWFSTFISTQDGLSWHYNIVNCGLSCRHRGQDPRGPLCVRPYLFQSVFPHPNFFLVIFTARRYA